MCASHCSIFIFPHRERVLWGIWCCEILVIMKLLRLELNSCHFTSETLHQSENFTIDSFVLNCSNIKKAYIDEGSNLPHLIVSRCRRLKSLEIGKRMIKSWDWFQYLRELEFLTELKLVRCRLVEESLVVSEFEKLKVYSIRSYWEARQDAEVLQKNPILKEIKVSETCEGALVINKYSTIIKYVKDDSGKTLMKVMLC